MYWRMGSALRLESELRLEPVQLALAAAGAWPPRARLFPCRP